MTEVNYSENQNERIDEKIHVEDLGDSFLVELGHGDGLRSFNIFVEDGILVCKEQI